YMKKEFALQEYFVAGGTLWREAPSYIVRPADEELFRLTFAGEYCNVLAARQMGKSSLMVRTANRLNESGVRTAILDISILGGGISTPEAWFFGFLDELAVQLGLDEDVDAWWEAHANHSPVQRFSNFLRDVVLENIQGPITIFVDEIDSALGMAFTDDFFAAIRAAYNARASHPEFQRLTFILLGVARPADLIRDRNRTPYNIGTHIHLSDFTLPELQPFQAVFRDVYPGQGTEIVEWVLDWTNGQPYLTQKLCADLMYGAGKVCTQESVNQTVTRLFFTEEASKESNLLAIRDRIESSPHKTKMLQIYGQILREKPVLDEERSPAKTELKLTGLVRPSAQGRLEVRNRIYRTVFDQAWVRKSLPQSRTRQLAILASLLAILAFIVAGYALYRQQIQASLTFAEQFQTSNSPDVKLTSLARLLELDAPSNSQVNELYSSLAQAEKLSLFTKLSSPQNVSTELVIVIEAVYQYSENTLTGNEILGAMKTVLGQIGAAGAPSLKTEIGFWLKGREEANENHHELTAVSFYDSAWAESVTRGHPNYSVRFDRAMALIALEDYASAFEDLQAVWEQNPARQEEITTAIHANPTLAAYIFVNPAVNPAILAFITPVRLASNAEPTLTPKPSSTLPPSPTKTQNPTPSLTSTPEQPSPFIGWIAFGLGEGSRREIVIINPATRIRRQITNNGVIDEAPSFSPDNWKLVYASDRSQGGWELYAYDLRKDTEQQLTAFNGQVHFPVWSPMPGDTRIVFEGRTFEPEYAVNIWMFDTASGDLQQLTTGGADSRPGWSPDGTQILFGRATMDTTGDGRINVNDASDLYTLDLASWVEKNLTNTPAFDDFNSAWSPDGEWIAFTSVRLDVNGDKAFNLSDSQDLFLIRAEGRDERRLNLEGKQVFSPSWSPDGRFILVLVAYANGQNEIWRYDTINGNFIPLTQPGAYYHPTYSNPAVSSPLP
ncbi:MAG TPA: AAA-like domain-containing protein, partial [Anaerolineales bacterium]|nr:AAA-like domain-containing protein [Anaerolineales bacterium]